MCMVPAREIATNMKQSQKKKKKKNPMRCAFICKHSLIYNNDTLIPMTCEGRDATFV